MKKYLLVFSILMFTLPICAQYNYMGADSAEVEVDSAAAEPDYVTRICGVDFGADFETAKTILENKFGTESAYAENYQLTFKDKSYAGVFFDELIFGFQSDGKRTYFNKCVLCIAAKNAEDAKRKRDYLHSVLSDKYFMVARIDDNKFKFYNGGSSPICDGEWGFFIDVFHEGNLWYARLFYGPYDYVKEEF